MPVVQQTPYSAHVANGVSDTFGYTFQLILGTDLEVKLDGVVQSSGYTVSGLGVQAGGDVTFSSIPANNTLVELTRKIPRARSTNYPYLGDLPESVVDADFDRIWQAIQDLAYFADTLGLKLPAGDTAAPMTLPNVATRANNFMAFDALGKAIAVAGVTGVPVSSFMASVVAALTASAARTLLVAAASGSAAASGLTMATGRLLGRTTASTGAIEEITAGSGLSLSGGVLSATGGSYLTGQVVQAVSVTKTDTWSTSSTSMTDVTGLSASITPRKNTNKILAIVSIALNGQSTVSAHAQLVRGSTAIGIGDAAGSRTRSTLTVTGNASYVSGSATANFVDSPATTSATTYKVQAMTGQGGTTAYVNRSQNDADSADNGRGISTLTLLEIDA